MSAMVEIGLCGPASDDHARMTVPDEFSADDKRPVVNGAQANSVTGMPTVAERGYNLPVDRVAAACEHIDALAKAAKRADDARPIDHIRADLFLGMTDGTYTGLDDATILERLRANCGHDDSAPGRQRIWRGRWDRERRDW